MPLISRRACCRPRRSLGYARRERLLERHAHAVEVVLAEEHHRRLPEGGEVERLVELAFAHTAVAEDAERDGDPASCTFCGQPQAHARGRWRATMA